MKKQKMCKIVIMIITVLLLFAFIVMPVSADEITVADGATPPYGSALSDFQSMLHALSDNYAYTSMIDYYNGFGDSRFFNVNTMVSGTDIVNRNSVVKTIDLEMSLGDSSYTGTLFADIYTGCITYAIYLGDGDAPDIYNVLRNGFVRLSYYYDGENDCRMTVSFFGDESTIGNMSLTYIGSYGLNGISLSLNTLTVNNTTYSYSDIYTIEYAFTLNDSYTPTMFGVLLDLLVINSFADYNDVVYSPYSFYYGIDAFYNYGYDDGVRYGYNAGYDDGYNEGVAVSYDLGYQDAVDDIESGDFGRNFLGGLFTAPIDAMKDFEIISWTTANGVEVSITLMTLFSAVIGLALFIWFLKMFAGG